MPDVKIIKLEKGLKYQRLFSKDSGTRGMKAGHVALKAGESVGEHTTGKALEEALVILKGKGGLTIDGNKVLRIEAGSVLYIPPDTVHDVKNSGPEDLEYIFITSRPEA